MTWNSTECIHEWLVQFQWLSFPFALKHDAVHDIKLNATDNWIKSLDEPYIGQYVDSYLLLIFGGIPWQVTYHFIILNEFSVLKSNSVTFDTLIEKGQYSISLNIPIVFSWIYVYFQNLFEENMLDWSFWLLASFCWHCTYASVCSRVHLFNILECWSLPQLRFVAIPVMNF